MTTWIYVGLVALLAAALPVTWWLKRAGDREWAEHSLTMLAPGEEVISNRHGQGKAWSEVMGPWPVSIERTARDER